MRDLEADQRPTPGLIIDRVWAARSNCRSVPVPDKSGTVLGLGTAETPVEATERRPHERVDVGRDTAGHHGAGGSGRGREGGRCGRGGDDVRLARFFALMPSRQL
jgi:hypothetical protein